MRNAIRIARQAVVASLQDAMFAAVWRSTNLLRFACMSWKTVIQQNLQPVLCCVDTWQAWKPYMLRVEDNIAKYMLHIFYVILGGIRSTETYPMIIHSVYNSSLFYSNYRMHYIETLLFWIFSLFDLGYSILLYFKYYVGNFCLKRSYLVVK
jgi:hypothetical protein